MTGTQRRGSNSGEERGIQTGKGGTNLAGGGHSGPLGENSVEVEKQISPC